MEKYFEEFAVESGVLQVRVSGTFPNERVAMKKNLFEPLIEACRKENCRMAIVDARALQVDFNTAELFRVGVDAAALNDFRLRVALVARADMLSSFFDDVTYNRAAPVHVFTDLKEARDWIDERLPVAIALGA
jgi:hypothetical protein